MTTNKKLFIFIPMILVLLIILLPIIQLTFSQRMVVGGLMLVVFWWATGAVNRTISSVLLLIIFTLFGNTPVNDVFYFPLSEAFILVICSLLLAEGIVKSQIAMQIANIILNKYVTSSATLVAMSFILGIVLIFIIPHPYPRVIILSAIFKVILKQSQVTGKYSEVFMFSIFVAGTCTPMLFLNGDFVLNYALLDFAQLNLTWSEWALYMTIPSLITCIILFGLFLYVFRNELKEMVFTNRLSMELSDDLKTKRIPAYIIIFLVMVLWITEFIHGIESAYIALGGVIAMLSVGLLETKDFKRIKFELLLNLTAVFAIGKVLKSSGVASIIQHFLIAHLPLGSVYQLLFLTILIVLVIHLMLGSCLTSMSVTIPILIALFGSNINPLIIAMVAYITVSIHYLLPYHHLTLVLGSGENYFSDKMIIRFGVPMTLLIFAIIFFVYLPWWRLVGLH